MVATPSKFTGSLINNVADYAQEKNLPTIANAYRSLADVVSFPGNAIEKVSKNV